MTLPLTWAGARAKPGAERAGDRRRPSLVAAGPGGFFPEGRSSRRPPSPPRSTVSDRRARWAAASFSWRTAARPFPSAPWSARPAFPAQTSSRQRPAIPTRRDDARSWRRPVAPPQAEARNVSRPAKRPTASDQRARGAAARLSWRPRARPSRAPQTGATAPPSRSSRPTASDNRARRAVFWPAERPSSSRPEGPGLLLSGRGGGLCLSPRRSSAGVSSPCAGPASFLPRVAASGFSRRRRQSSPRDDSAGTITPGADATAPGAGRGPKARAFRLCLSPLCCLLIERARRCLSLCGWRVITVTGK